MNQNKTEPSNRSHQSVQFSRIETLSPKKLAGRSIEMSMVDNKTIALWKSFMPYRNEIKHRIDENLYSLQEYPTTLSFEKFDPSMRFIKHALVEVQSYDDLPPDMDSYDLEGGLYAVFNHQGSVAQFPATMAFIFEKWLPNSKYLLDNREHFEVLGKKYKHNDPSSQEEVWIPIVKNTN